LIFGPRTWDRVLKSIQISWAQNCGPLTIYLFFLFYFPKRKSVKQHHGLWISKQWHRLHIIYHTQKVKQKRLLVIPLTLVMSDGHKLQDTRVIATACRAKKGSVCVPLILTYSVCITALSTFFLWLSYIWGSNLASRE
jgi:hypothetical protein